LKNIEKNTIKLLKTISGQKDVHLNSDLFDDLNLDSMKFITIVVSLENKFNINIENLTEKADFSKIVTVGDLVNLIVSVKGGGK
jgi:acyl carrier protein